ncbi:MAG: IclR family transcriptional regulator [Rhodovulum sulfidophilum]|uniref:IclR family transcriptional regulator n=1 Tax=Rhodovulum sulfidophilum TaxID=35806 RepID=A0A2W5NAV3_RHOSU|nr:MAG: IclR family transcriptional regulator [Rhodovulum sulfidophilum]
MSDTEQVSAKDGGIQVISRAFAVLRALDRNGSSLGALAKATGLPRSTVQRIVDSLAAENVVEIGDSGVRPGWGLQQLAQAGQSIVVQRVRPQLQTLFEATRETVDISTFHGRQVTFLDRIISDQELRVVPFNDRPRPLHAMANGKAMLSLLDDDRIAALLPEPLARLTPLTLTTLDALRKELDAVRREGFSYDREEHALGVCAIGAPINVPGLPPHAISAVMPATRFEARLPELKEALRACRVAMVGALRMP